MAPARILHLSDLHMGKREEPELGPALAGLVAELDPELVVASGDLTHRGRRDQHERAHAFLAALGPPGDLEQPGQLARARDVLDLEPAGGHGPVAEQAARQRLLELDRTDVAQATAAARRRRCRRRRRASRT